jgi:hypothetical protein
MKNRKLNRVERKIKGWLVENIALPLIRNHEKDSPLIKHYLDEGGQNRDIIDLLAVFGTQGHSGSSAPLTARLFEKAAMFKILSPLKFTDNEFGTLHGDSQQNRRMSSVFKDTDKSGTERIYDIDAITWTEKSGKRFDMNGEDFFDCDYAKMGYGFHGGSVMVYSKINDTWRCLGSRQEIINRETFMGKNQVRVPVIEIDDSSDTKNDYVCYFTLEEYIPQNFYLDYQFMERDKDEEYGKMLEICKKHKNSLIEALQDGSN